jgi:hypothetical protein
MHDLPGLALAAPHPHGGRVGWRGVVVVVLEELVVEVEGLLMLPQEI